MSELVSLRCPNCGAPLHTGEITCPFCGSTLAVGHASEVALPAVAEAQQVAARMRERIQANPYDGDAYYQLGLACFTLQLYDQAENAFRQSVRFLPGSAQPHYFIALSILYAQAEEILSIGNFRLHQAQEELATAAQLDPSLENARAYFLLVKGLSARANGDYQAALEPLRHAVETLPTLELGWKVLAACYFQVGRFHDAIQVGARAMQLRPNDDGNLYLLGAAYSRLGNCEQEEHYARRVARLRGDPERWPNIVREYRGEFD